jgi:hypothetical protein
MSKFQSVVSTVAALGTIAVTTVTAYKYVGNTRLYNAEQEAKIKTLQTQLKQQVAAPLTQPLPTVLPPVTTPATTPDPTKEGSAQAPTPPPLPPVQ